MVTRAQKNAQKEASMLEARNRAALADGIAASLREYQASSPTSNAPWSHRAMEAPQPAAALVTPEKKTRKRKLSVSAPSSRAATVPATSALAVAVATRPVPLALPQATAPEADISPAVRDAKRRSVMTASSSPPTKPMTNAKATTIRRTLDYADAATPPPAQDDASSARDVLQRVSSGDKESCVVVGRAEERLQIERVFASADATRALFVVGPPGTGKSSCVAHVASRHTDTTTVVRVNCSTFTTPAALMDAVRDHLSTNRITPRHLPDLDDAQQLDAFLTEALHASPKHCVLVLDEVDHLVRLPSAALQRKAQRLLAFFVRWAHLPNAALRFVGVLNGVDMHAEIAAFLAHDPNPARVVLFPSYALDELVAILEATVRAALGSSNSKLEDVVEPRALELIARKVAARDGDARRAVGLLRQCARACLSSPESEKLCVRDVLKCTSAAIASQLSVAKQIQQLPRAPKVLLYAVTRLSSSCDTSSVTLQDVVGELQMLRDTHASLAWLPRFRLEELQQHLGALECYALVKQTPAKSKSAWHARLASTIAMDALVRAFQDDALLTQLPMPSRN